MSKSKPIFFSTGVFRHNDLPAILAGCEAAEVSCLELSSGVRPSSDYQERVLSAGHVQSFLIHNYFPPPESAFVLNLAATNKETLYRSQEHCRNAIDLCSDVGSPFYSVHAGFALNLTPDLLGKPKEQAKLHPNLVVPPETAYEIFAESVARLNEYAIEKGVGLLIENNVVTSTHVAEGKGDTFLMVRSEEVLRLIGDISSDNLGILVDVGHLKVSARALKYSPEQFMDNIRKNVKAFHLSENDGLTDQNLPITKHSWFWPSIRNFPEAVVILEAYNLTLGQIKSQKKLIENQFKL